MWSIALLLFYIVVIQNKMWDYDGIDHVLEKLMIEDALQELFQNQEKL